MKVFGIGLNKTGTTTLAACLQELGFRHTSCNLDLTRSADRGELAPILEHADQYESFEDWPWPLVYKELDQRYEHAKFILTRRANASVWFNSLKRHALRTGPTEYREIAYGYPMPLGKKEEHIAVYRRHNRDVREYFSGRRGDLLEICWEEGDEWDELCAFLKRPKPDKPLPHEKRGRSEFLSTLSYVKNVVQYTLFQYPRNDSSAR
jgi:hypothetical protein